MGFFKSNYFKGIFWCILGLIVSSLNDAITKYLGNNDLHSIQITFLRFFFGTVGLLPFMLMKGVSSFKTTRPGVHFLRGCLLFVGIGLWCYGLKIAPMATVTTITFTIPIFTLILALFFLSEKVGISRWIATFFGFLGIVVVLRPTAGSFEPMSLVLVGSAVLFAMLDIMNKKFVVKESMLCMLFYSTMFTAALALIPAIMFWKMPTMRELMYFMALGFGANLILYCILKSFSYADATALAPFRYVELIVSALTGFLVFAEIPGKATWLGSLIIIPSALFIIYSESFKKKEVELDLSDDALSAEGERN